MRTRGRLCAREMHWEWIELFVDYFHLRPVHLLSSSRPPPTFCSHIPVTLLHILIRLLVFPHAGRYVTGDLPVDPIPPKISSSSLHFRSKMHEIAITAGGCQVLFPRDRSYSSKAATAKFGEALVLDAGAGEVLGIAAAGVPVSIVDEM